MDHVDDKCGTQDCHIRVNLRDKSAICHASRSKGSQCVRLPLLTTGERWFTLYPYHRQQRSVFLDHVAGCEQGRGITFYDFG